MSFFAIFCSILAVLGNSSDKETAIILRQCMTEVWKMVTAETVSSSDQQQKLLELLDTLSTKAMMVSPPGVFVCLSFELSCSVGFNFFFRIYLTSVLFFLSRYTGRICGDVESVEAMYYHW